MFGRKSDEPIKPEGAEFRSGNSKKQELSFPYAARQEKHTDNADEAQAESDELLLNQEELQEQSFSFGELPKEKTSRVEPSLTSRPHPSQVRGPAEPSMKKPQEEEPPHLEDLEDEVEDNEQVMELSAITEPKIEPKQEKKVKEEHMERLLTVGFETSLNGEISGCDRLVIEGAAKVTVSEVDTMEISSTGSFDGTADVKEAHIKGKFTGDLIVSDKLVIYETGKIIGNVSYDSIEIKHGGEMSGKINTLGTMDNNAKSQIKSEKNNKTEQPSSNI